MSFHDLIEEWPPTKGPNGSPVVSSLVGGSHQVQHHVMPPPSPPTREVPIFGEGWDVDEEAFTDDAIVGHRTLTDEEFEAATADYEQRRAEWERTGGVFIEQGPITHEAHVECADGSTADAIGDGKRGRWVKYSPKETKKPTV